jgi:predicted esterase
VTTQFPGPGWAASHASFVPPAIAHFLLTLLTLPPAYPTDVVPLPHPSSALHPSRAHTVAIAAILHHTKHACGASLLSLSPPDNTPRTPTHPSPQPPSTMASRCRTFPVVAALVVTLLAPHLAHADPHSLSVASRPDVLSLPQASITLVAKSLSSVLNDIISTSGASLPGGGAGTSPITTSSVNGDSNGGDGLTFPAAVQPALFTVVLLHGSGGKSSDLVTIVTAAQLGGLQRTRFILPQAPTQFLQYRNKVEPSWFNIAATSQDAKEFGPEIVAAADRINNIIAGEYKAKIPAGNVAIVGLSQGGAVVTTVYMRSPHKLKAAVGLATWLPLPSSYPAAQSSANPSLPFRYIHGSADKVIEPQWAKSSVEVMRAAGRTVNFELIDGASHTFDAAFFSVGQKAIDELKARGLS